VGERPGTARLAPLKVVYPTFAALAFALLPGWARALYGMPAGEPAAGRAGHGRAAGTADGHAGHPERFRGGTPIQRRYVYRALELMHTQRPGDAAVEGWPPLEPCSGPLLCAPIRNRAGFPAAQTVADPGPRSPRSTLFSFDLGES